MIDDFNTEGWTAKGLSFMFQENHFFHNCCLQLDLLPLMKRVRIYIKLRWRSLLSYNCSSWKTIRNLRIVRVMDMTVLLRSAMVDKSPLSLMIF